MSSGVVVVGAGGHAKVCIELLSAAGYQVDVCVGGDDDTGACVGVPIVSGDAHLARLREAGYHKAFVALGSNGARRRLAAVVTELGYQLVNAVSPAAVVSPSARLGVGVAIMAGAVVNAEASIGDLAIINTGATVDHDCVIGEAVHVAPQSALAGNVRIGRGTFLGIGTTVIPGRTIGCDVMVGAGGVVISDLPDGVTAVGVPARPIPTPA